MKEREKLEAFNCNEDKVGWDGCPFDPHMVYDQEEADKVYKAYENEIDTLATSNRALVAEKDAKDEEIRKLLYELAKAKAYWWKYTYTNCDTYGFWTKGYRTKATKKDCMTYREQWLRIAEALERRAAKILEGK